MGTGLVVATLERYSTILGMTLGESLVSKLLDEDLR